MLYFFIEYCLYLCFNSVFNFLLICNLTPVILLSAVMEGLILMFILSAESCCLTSHVFMLESFEVSYPLQHIFSLKTLPKSEVFLSREDLHLLLRGTWMPRVSQNPIPHCGQPVLVNMEGRLFSPEAHAATDFALQSPLLDMFFLIHCFTYCVTNQGAQVFM